MSRLLTAPLWWVVQRAEAGPYLRRDAQRFAEHEMRLKPPKQGPQVEDPVESPSP